MNPIHGHILVVDDSPDVQSVLSDTLQHAGHQISVAAHGHEALACLQANQIDLVITDIMMPEMNGYELLTAMKSDPQLFNIPVIVITAAANLSDAVRSIELGAEDYIGKPFQPVLLKARIQAALLRQFYLNRERSYWEQLETMYDDLQKANQTKNEFMALVAHELRAPLSTLWAYTELLKRLDNNAEQTEYLDNMQFSLDRMKTVVSDLEDIARVETGNLRLELERVDISRTIGMVQEAMRPELCQKGQQLIVDLPGDLPAVWADQARVIQILTNLVENAAKYSPSETAIEITAVPAPNHPFQLQISVHDQGPGITTNDQKQVFEKFFRSDQAQIQDVPGTGLGLNIAKSLVERLGGSIWFDSRIAEGTTFHFTLPLDNALDQLEWS
jgi:signal transduction histidine kinase